MPQHPSFPPPWQPKVPTSAPGKPSLGGELRGAGLSAWRPQSERAPEKACFLPLFPGLSLGGALPSASSSHHLPLSRRFSTKALKLLFWFVPLGGELVAPPPAEAQCGDTPPCPWCTVGSLQMTGVISRCVNFEQTGCLWLPQFRRCSVALAPHSDSTRHPADTQLFSPLLSHPLTPGWALLCRPGARSTPGYHLLPDVPPELQTDGTSHCSRWSCL